jgi:hypothetical protein
MLRITTTYRLAETGGCYLLRLTGRLQDDPAQELRRLWCSLRTAVPRVPIFLELADVDGIDAAGRVLLGEMRRAGVGILAHESPGEPIRDDRVDVEGRSTSASTLAMR